MIELKALQKQVALLEADLKPTGLSSDRLKVEWRAAKSADRTAATFETWLGERVTQVAVAWVLATVFVRFCEDNGLIEYPFIAGPGDRVQLAVDLQQEFILDYTLDPAIAEFGLEPAPPVGHEDLPPGLRVIDPACGSGHFLLGAFRRLLSAWETASPTTDRYELVAKALSSVHGVDKNPFAAAIARFRLMLAAMRAAGVERLTERVDFPINIAVGDSLLHGKGSPGRQGEFDFGGEAGAWTYRTEDVEDYIKSCHILEYGSYHVVVANPPYINVEDSSERDNYRKSYKSCSGKYALSVPFAERIFQLAILGTGYTGQITSNSFMKREFGKKLIEQFFPSVDLTHVIDTSGAFIPGHGTPTVILIGRRRFARSDSTIRAVLGVRGEPVPPEDPAEGSVWQAIVQQIGRPGSESLWVSVDDLERDHLASHPWSLSGGGAGEAKEIIEQAATRLDQLAESIGITSVTGEDDLYLLPRNGAAKRLRVDATRLLVTGDIIRDYTLDAGFDAAWTYDHSLEVQPLDKIPGTARFLIPYRAAISHRRRFGTPMIERGLTWYEWQELYAGKLRTPLSITFAEVATHNHFVFDRGGKAFKQTAPVIKLPEGATEDDHPRCVPTLKLGQRSFEIVMARRMESGELQTPWFTRHRSTPITEIPHDWPEEYRRVVERRIEIIESNRNIGLIERPECKRRWQSEPWDVREARRLTTWLLDKCEDRSLWYDGDEPRPMTVNRLADRLRTDVDVIATARQLKGPDADLADVLKEIIADEHVPFLAACRYKPSGLDKRAQWERTWDLQREEDATGQRLDIPVPPKYAGADFQKQSYWRHRGKLDVPRERFISYPGASPDSDKDSLLVGWAGWDHKDQATALIGLIGDRSTTDGWDTVRLTPLLAGLLEIMPWVRQWHSEIDPAFGQSPAEAYDAYLTSERESRNLTEDALRAWQPPQPQRGRRA